MYTYQELQSSQPHSRFCCKVWFFMLIRVCFISSWKIALIIQIGAKLLKPCCAWEKNLYTYFSVSSRAVDYSITRSTVRYDATSCYILIAVSPIRGRQEGTTVPPSPKVFQIWVSFLDCDKNTIITEVYVYITTYCVTVVKLDLPIRGFTISYPTKYLKKVSNFIFASRAKFVTS